jgi:GNAT superfamily N-acetyltransferase
MSLNEYLCKHANQDNRSHLGRTFVLTEDANPAYILGYFTLAAGAVQRDVLPEKHLPQYPIPVALLGRLAVDRTAQGRGLGQWLLMAALHRVISASAYVAVYAVVVDALHERAREVYLHHQFRPTPGDPLRLYIPVKQIRSWGLDGDPG